jgi:hypothetical protein
MAAALNLERVAHTLVAMNLASVSDRGVTISRSLLAVSRVANDESFAHIARLLLERAPPPWLRVAVGEDGVRREYIPQTELDAMAWLRGRLDALLLQVYGTITAERDDAFRKRLGDAAEHVVLAALERLGGEVLHVAALSDGFGYDIEHRTVAGIARIEVKAATAQTADGFFLSRNEFEKSRVFGAEWRLVQVIFKPSAFLGTEISTAHVEAIRELSAGTIGDVVPADTPEFVWQESAHIRPPSLAWRLSAIAPAPDVGGLR